ncbi:uncharacterized protein LOC126576872 [Anopheles aquasalis]|uniref:uncharacterized protein LOC126576872 n=1 Tax=Anopheles aquasalis TaxID=42839 RepID=UPI00215A7CFE|nr:uncharacterized protein LOC126576872 [Anopheles aquasalis]
MFPRRGQGIDAAPPSLLVESVLKTGRMAHDMQQRCCIVRENKNLLRKINQIYRTKGFLNVDYSFRAHQSLHSENQERMARRIERENRILFERIVQRKPTVDSRAPRKLLIPRTSNNDEHRMLVDFWERSGRWLCQLAIEVCPDARESFLPCSGKLFRIYAGVCLVFEGGHSVRQDEESSLDTGTLSSVSKGSVVRQILNRKEYVLVALSHLEGLSDAQFLGRVAAMGSKDQLDLLNSYGSKYGRLLEPIRFEIVQKKRR